MKQSETYPDSLFLYEFSTLYQVAVRIISICNDPRTYHRGDTAPTDMIPVCFLPTAEHHYTTRVISPMSTELLSPHPIAMEAVSPGVPIDTKDKALIQEGQIQILTEPPGVPDTDTMLQEKVVDISLHTPIIDIGPKAPAHP